MRGWIDLPEELKRECVKRMSFISSLSLRLCSKSHQKLVDSTPICIRRVRVTEGENDFALDIYMAIERPYRFVFASKNGKSFVKRFDKTDDPSYVKTVRYSDTYELFIRNLKTILFRSHVFIDAYESLYRHPNHENRFMNLIGVKEWPNVKQYVGNLYGSQMFVLYNFFSDDVKTTWLGCSPIEASSYPCAIVESIVDDKIGQDNIIFGFPNGVTLDFLKTFPRSGPTYELEIISFPTVHFQQAWKFFDKLPGKIEERDKWYGVKWYEDAKKKKIIKWHVSECGLYMHVIKKGTQVTGSNYTKCGRGLGCPLHCDPFVTWYHDHLLYRIVQDEKHRHLLIQQEFAVPQVSPLQQYLDENTDVSEMLKIGQRNVDERKAKIKEAEKKGLKVIGTKRKMMFTSDQPGCTIGMDTELIFGTEDQMPSEDVQEEGLETKIRQSSQRLVDKLCAACEPEVVVVEPEVVLIAPDVVIPLPDVVVPQPEVVVVLPEVIVPETDVVDLAPDVVVGLPDIIVPESEVIASQPDVVLPEPENVGLPDVIAPEADVAVPEHLIADVKASESLNTMVEMELAEDAPVIPENSETSLVKSEVSEKQGKKEVEVTSSSGSSDSDSDSSSSDDEDLDDIGNSIIQSISDNYTVENWQISFVLFIFAIFGAFFAYLMMIL